MLCGMGAVTAVLQRWGIDEAELADLLDAELTALFAPLEATVALPADVQSLLEGGRLRFGGSPDRAVLATGAAWAALLGSCVTPADVAGALGVDASRVRHRLADGALLSLPGAGRRRLLPRFQLDTDLVPLPGLAVVLAALPADLHPLEVEGFFTTPQPDLVVRRKALSPREFLLAGGDPALVARAAAGVADALL